MGGLRKKIWTAILALGLSGLASEAGAASDICMRLEARLMALDSNPVNSEVEKYRAADRAVDEQRAKLDAATDEARRAGCLGGLFSRLKPGGNCGAMTAGISRMRANLNRLSAARNRYSDDPFDNGRERGELVEALAENRCGDQYEMAERPRQRGLFATLFGGHLFRERGWGSAFDDGEFGTYRTLCVRTCDGYYFPINFSTTRSHFAADADACRARCPGTEVELYIHHNPGQEADQMVSLAGEPYTALPAAFRYRREYDKACSCGTIVAPAATLVAELATEPAAYSGHDPWGFARRAEAEATSPPMPPLRPAVSEDPETLANRAGSFIPKRLPGPSAATVAGLDSSGERQVRIVGPSYFYGQ